MDPWINAAEAVLGPARAAGRGGATALLWRELSLSYDELDRRVSQAANMMVSLGLSANDRVVLLTMDSPAFVACYLGTMRAGGVAVALNLRASADDLLFTLNDSGARILVIDRASLALFESIAGELDQSVDAIPVDFGDGASMPLGERLDRHDDTFASVKRAPDDMAFWIYTSGTTGRSKGAVHRQQDVIHADPYVRDVLGVGPGDRLFATSKLFFAYSLGTCLFASLRLGATSILFDAWPDAISIAGIVERFRPNVVFSVPTMYRNLLDQKVTGGEAFSKVRHYVSAGERLPASLWEKWKAATGVEILDGMGTSETIYMLLTNWPDRVLPGASGTAAPGADIKLADSAGRRVTDGQAGILWARIASRASEYWNNPEASAAAFQGDWFKTGDMYVVDDRGYWHHQGRGDDMLKISGQWVSPAEIEEVVIAHTPVRDAAVVATETVDELTRTTLFAVGPEDGFDQEEMADLIRQTVTARLSPYKCPKWIKFIEEIPRTATGKIQRYRLKNAPG